MGQVWEGNHVFIWQIDHIYGGNLDQIIQRAKELGYTGVLIKFANGSLAGDPNSQHYMNQFRTAAPRFKEAGFVVGGWIYQYLTDVPGEVEACSQALAAGADWLVLDGEDEVANKQTAVASFGRLLRERHPGVTVGFSSFPIYRYHTEIPFREYADFCQVLLPQIYWDMMGWTLENAFATTVEQYRSFGRPLAPTGQAFGGATPQEIKKFIQLCKDAGFGGTSWWSWQHATAQQLAATSTPLYAAPAADPGSDPAGGGQPDAGQDGKSPQANGFPDVPSSRWSHDAIARVTAAGIMRGYPDGTFRPDRPLTREEAAVAIDQLLARRGGSA